MATAIHKLHDDFLSCNICTELYQDPCTLGCGHTFCKRCLASFTKTQPDAIKAKSFLCPNCRQMTKVSNPTQAIDDWVKQIKPSFLIVGLLDSFASQIESDQVYEHLCFSCKQSGENTPASSHCHDCDISICARCAKGHKAIPVTSHHFITDLCEEVKVRRKRKVICKVHKSMIEFCCKACNRAVCQKCCILDHRKCDNVVTIESMVPEMKAVLKVKKQMMTGEVKWKKSVFTQKENDIKEITAQRSDIQTDMSKATQKVISLIKQKQKLLEDELAMLTEKEIGDLRGQMKSELIDIQMYQQHCEFIEHALAAESEMDMYDMYHMCQSGAITTVSDTDTQLQDASSTGRIMFVEGQTLYSNLSLGRLRTRMDEFDPGCKPTLIDKIYIKMNSDTAYPDPIDVVVVDVNGVKALVVTDYSNRCLKSLFHINKSPRHFSLSLSGRPWRLTKLVNNLVAVTLQSYKEILIVQVTQHLILLSRIRTQKMYRGLASLNGFKFVASCCNPPSLDIFDLKEYVQKSVKINALIKWPVFLSTMVNGHILVSDESNLSVCCLTVDGDVVFIYSPSGERALGLPRSITTSNTGDILLVDKKKNKVSGTY